MTAGPAVTVESLAPLAGIVARERTAGRHADRYDDARQEGLVRAWQVLARRPDAPRPYVVAAMRRGVGDVVRGRSAFGASSHRGRPDAHDTAAPLVVETEHGETLVREPADLRAADALDAVEVADPVRQAVASLPPADREVVFLRYWRGLGFEEISSLVGRPAGTLSRRWVEHTRPALREALADLDNGARKEAAA